MQKEGLCRNAAWTAALAECWMGTGLLILGLICVVVLCISHTPCRASLFWQHLSCIAARDVVGFPVRSPSWLAVVLRCSLVFWYPGWLLVCLAVG